MALPDDFLSLNLSARKPGAWEGTITCLDHRPKGTGIAFTLGDTTVTGRINRVQEKQEDGLKQYELTIGRSKDPDGRPLESALDKVVTVHTPRDPVAVLEESNNCLTEGDEPTYVNSSTMHSMRARTYRPTAAQYIYAAAASAGVTVFIEQGVIGAIHPVPFREIWDGHGSTIGSVIEELFGFGKPDIYVNASGWIQVRKPLLPSGFSAGLTDPQSRTLTDFDAEVASVQATCYAAAREWLCAYFGGPV
jgi:hypothetical protein